MQLHDSPQVAHQIKQEGMEIFTRRFLLREFTPLDQAALLEYRGDPRYAEFCTPEETTPAYTHQLLQRFQQWAMDQPRQNYQLAVVLRQEPQPLLGCCGLRSEGYPAAQAELGLELAPQYWGRYAYAIEIAQAMIEFGFRTLGLQSIVGQSINANLRVERLASRYGFTKVRT